MQYSRGRDIQVVPIPIWHRDELARAGPEQLDPTYVAPHDAKALTDCGEQDVCRRP